MFGDGSLVANSYVNGTAQFRLVTTQSVFAANLRGEPFSTWAGPVALAVGAEARRDHAVGTSDLISQRVNANGSVGGWILGNQLPEIGTIKVFEAYAEAQAPLAKGLSVNGAVRLTHYSLSGTVYTWKIGGSYEPFTGLRLPRDPLARHPRAQHRRAVREWRKLEHQRVRSGTGTLGADPRDQRRQPEPQA